MHIATWGWNLTGYLHNRNDRLTYLFYVNNIDEYDPYGSVTSTGGVQSNDLYNWILNYNKSYAKGTLPIKNGSISADLFMDDIDDNRKMNNENGVIQKGYSYYDFDAERAMVMLDSLWVDKNAKIKTWISSTSLFILNQKFYSRIL